MKLLYTIPCTLLLMISLSASAKIWRVNNNPGIQADYSTLQEAHNAAASGDTIHIEGSPSAYGGGSNTNLSKKLYIVGPGYYLPESPNTQASLYPAYIGALTIHAGAEGTVLTGLDFNGSSINIYCNNITIQRNKFIKDPFNGDYESAPGSVVLHYVGSTVPVSDIVISQNFGLIVEVRYASTNILIANNWLTRGSNESDATGSPVISVNANGTALIQNNVIRRGAITSNHSTITNNIMIKGFVNGANNAYSNNLSDGAQFGTGNGNQSNVVMANVFVGQQTGTPFDARYKLRAGSPAIGAGQGSTTQNPIDAGIYGGNTPYITAGQTRMPAIYSMEVKAVGTSTDPITVKLKVKAAGK